MKNQCAFMGFVTLSISLYFFMQSRFEVKYIDIMLSLSYEYEKLSFSSLLMRGVVSVRTLDNYVDKDLESELCKCN